MKILRTFIKLFALPISLFLLHLVFEAFRAYKITPWLDIPMHLVGGSFIAFSFNLTFKYFQERKLIPELHHLVKAAFLFSFVATSTVLWEFGEFTIDYLFHTSAQNSLQDTISDMFLGIAGGLVFICCILLKLYRFKTQKAF